jgi:DNA polymerase V
MVNAGINHGDMLVVDTALQPKHRDIVIAVLDGGFTLKRLYLEGPEIRLLSGNPEYPSIVVTKEMDFFVHGVVTTIIRTFNPLPYDNHVKDLSYSHLRGKSQE